MISALLYGGHSPSVGIKVSAYFVGQRLQIDTMNISVDVADIIVSVGGFEHDELFLNWEESTGTKWALKPDTAHDIQIAMTTAPTALKSQFAKWHGRNQHIKLVWGTIAAIVAFCLLSVLLLWWQYDRALSWMVEKIPVASEEKIGESLLEQLRTEGDIAETGVAVQAIHDIGAKLTTGSRYHYQWVIKRDDTLNAFALPGGVVVVHSALIKKAENPDELAAVLAHEVQHIEQRHSLKNAVNSLGWAAILTITLGDVSAVAATMAHQMGAMYFSRDLEDEADRLGYAALVRAKIKPDGMVTFFQKMAKEEKGDIPAWGSSHPATLERINTIQDLMRQQPCAACQPLVFDWPQIQVQAVALDKK
jgi:Zn-dependent protease with chaperone function